MSDKLQSGAKAGSTEVSLPVLLTKTADGTELTGTASGSVTASYWRQGGTRTAITVVALTNVNDSYSSGGWKEVDSTNQPGLYRFDVPDAAFATGADWVIITVKVATAFVYNERINLTTNVIQGADNNVILSHASYGNAQLVRSTTPANTLSVDSSNRAYADLRSILGTALTETAGQIAAAFKKLFDVAAPVLTSASVNQTGDSFARLGAPVAASISQDIANLQTDVDNLPAAGAIRDAILDELLPGQHDTPDTPGKILQDLQGDTNDIQTRLPAALVSGRMDSSVGAMANDTLTAAAIATDAIDNDAIAASAVTEMQSGLATAANQTTILSNQATIAGYIDTEVAAIKAKTDNLPAAPAAVGDIPTTAQIATAVWDKATSALTTVGSIGKLLVDKMAFITSGVTLTVTNPVASSGDISEIIAGDDYYTADGRALQFSFTGQPDWTGATPVLYVNTPVPIEVTGTVSNPGTATQTLSFQLSGTETARGTIPDGRDLETYSFEISVTLSNGHETTPRRGKATFKRQLG